MMFSKFLIVLNSQNFTTIHYTGQQTIDSGTY